MVKELEEEVRLKEQDLRLFRDEVSKLNEQLERFINQLGQEISLAHLIQKILVPTEIPNIPGFDFSTKYEASAVSGGDYFDIFELEDKLRFGMLLSSCSGHGMSALFLSVLLKLSGHFEARKGKAPHETVTLIAKELVPNIPEGERAALFFGTIDRRVFELNYCQVGNLIGLYHNFDTNKLERLKASAPALSPDFNVSLLSHNLPLFPRDRLILLSAGFTKVKNQKGEFFEEERLYKIVLENPKASPHELRNEILYQVRQYSSGLELDRDLTAIVIEVQDRVLKLART